MSDGDGDGWELIFLILVALAWIAIMWLTSRGGGNDGDDD